MDNDGSAPKPFHPHQGPLRIATIIQNNFKLFFPKNVRVQSKQMKTTQHKLQVVRLYGSVKKSQPLLTASHSYPKTCGCSPPRRKKNTNCNSLIRPRKRVSTMIKKNITLDYSQVVPTQKRVGTARKKNKNTHTNCKSFLPKSVWVGFNIQR